MVRPRNDELGQRAVSKASRAKKNAFDVESITASTVVCLDITEREEQSFDDIGC
jgi:hypothetical protein